MRGWCGLGWGIGFHKWLSIGIEKGDFSRACSGKFPLFLGHWGLYFALLNKMLQIMKTYKSTKTAVEGMRTSRIILPKFTPLTGDNQTGVEVTSYGQGQVSGVMYTVPAHGQIDVNFKIKLNVVTPEDIQKVSDLIKSLLDASHKQSYSELSKTEVSGGASFFGFFGFGGASASYSDTKQTMTSYGLSEANQVTIVNAMMNLAQQMSEFDYSGTIYNKDYDYDVTGNLFAIVMDAHIQQSQQQNQLRFLAPNVHLNTQDGNNLPVIGQLYTLNN